MIILGILIGIIVGFLAGYVTCIYWGKPAKKFREQFKKMESEIDHLRDVIRSKV